jgi:type I restriction enzyme, S subunit
MSNKSTQTSSNETAINERIPKLRFPEFSNSPKWKKIKLITSADKKIKWSFTGGPFGSNLKSSDYTTDGVRIIQLQNIGDGEFIDSYKIYTSEQKADELLSCNIYPGDIILAKMGDPVARACLIHDRHSRYVMCSDGIRLAIDREKFNIYFIYSLINSDQFRKCAEKASTGSTRKRIGLDELKKLPIFAPSPIEQKKIADCLSSLDELIAAQSQKLEAIKAHKKGLMQQLFPAGGETVPKLRFSEFRSAPDWEESRLGEIATFFKGKGLPKSTITPKGKNLCIHYGELFTEYSEVIETIKSRTDFNDGCFLSVENDVLMPTSDVTPKGLAKACCINLGGVVLGGDILVIRTDKFLVSGEFLSRLIRHLEKQVLQLVSGSTVFHLYASSIEKLTLFVPSFEEQQKVAACLSSIDELIAAQTQKLDTLKAHKKGLMQQLFPSVDEVNG